MLHLIALIATANARVQLQAHAAARTFLRQDAQRMHHHRHHLKLATKDEDCAAYATPCDCTVPGCGWSTIHQECLAGAQTDCLECPNVLMCGDETCMVQMMDDPDVVAAQRAGKECIEDGNDMAVCLCDDAIGGLMETKLREADCCDANELFQQMCYNRKCDDVPDVDSSGAHAEAGSACSIITEPCECGVKPGCGWEAATSTCVSGGATDCHECPHSMLCHSNDENICTMALFKNPDITGAINVAKVCMQSERDGMEYCMRHAGDRLAEMIGSVEHNGETIDCCDDNVFFKMVCEGPTAEPAETPETTAAPADAEEDEEEPDEESEDEEEEATTTTTTTTDIDLMAEIERLAREYGLVTTTPAPDGAGSGGDGDGDGSGSDGSGADGSGSDGSGSDGSGSDGSGSDGSGSDGSGSDGAGSADGAGSGGAGSGGDGAGSGGDGAGSAGAGSGADGATALSGNAGSAAMDAAAKNTYDQVQAQNAVGVEEEEVPARKVGF